MLSSTSPKPLPATGINPLRARDGIRDLLAPPDVLHNQLIQILLVSDSITSGVDSPIRKVSLENLEQVVEGLYVKGIRAIKLFAHEDIKDLSASACADEKNVCIRAIKKIKSVAKDIVVITETCLCPYTEAGNCVLIDKDGRTDVELTCRAFEQIALSQARAGADVLGPAAMADGTVSVVKRALVQAGFYDVAIMPHLEFRSSLYDVYRKAMGTGTGLHRAGFQIDPRNEQQAINAAINLMKEGADMLLIEPSLFYLDILTKVKASCSCPVGAFSVSGEAVLFGSISDEASRRKLMKEYFFSVRRAGADFLVGYFTEELIA